MNSGTLPAARVCYAPQLKDYLPHTDEEPLSWQLPSYGRAWARLTVRDALRPLIAQPSPTPDRVLAEAREIMARLETAIPAWTAAVETFATCVAPQIEDRIEATTQSDYEAALVEVLDREFFGRFAPDRAGSGSWAEADRVIRTSLRDLKDRGYVNVEDVVCLQQGTLLDPPIEIRAVRLGLAKFAHDAALGPCPTPEERRLEELRLAGEVEAIFGIRGLVQAWVVNEGQAIEDLEHARAGSIAEAPQAMTATLWNVLRVPLPVWQFLGDFLGRDGTPAPGTRQERQPGPRHTLSLPQWLSGSGGALRSD